MPIENIIQHCCLFPVRNLGLYLTNWTVELTGITNFVFLLSLLDKRVNEKKGWLAFTHLLFEISAGLNICVVLVYWSIVHEKEIPKWTHNNYMYAHMYLVHTLPALSLLMIFLSNDVVFKSGHWRACPPTALAYAIVNYLETKKRGAPLYWFLTWEDHTSVLISAAMAMGMSAIWVGAATLTQALKAHMGG